MTDPTPTTAISKEAVARALDEMELENLISWLFEAACRARERGNDRMLAAIRDWRLDHQLAERPEM